MPNLSFVGLSDDGAALILSSGDGARHRVPIDERLRSAVRTGRAQLEAPDGPIGAKEIQARLRAGATAAEVADFSGWSEERVEAFAAPILQERGWVAEQAQKCAIGRGEDDPPLGELVDNNLIDRGVDLDAVRWDSWRRDDGQWTILLAYPAGKGDRVATWQFDVPAKSLVPEDDEARSFSEGPGSPQRPRLLRVPNDDEPRADPSWGNHPAGRGGEPVRSADQEPAQPIPSTETTDQRPQQSERPATSDAPRWDEVLFGSPIDEK